MLKKLCLYAGVLGVPLLADADPALTIYNQNFAVVRDTVPLDLKAGVNNVQYVGATAQVERTSVTLRAPREAHPLQILEQNYRADVLTPDYLLSLCEGKTINFRVVNGDQVQIVPGKVIRSGYQVPPPRQSLFDSNAYGYDYSGQSIGFQYDRRAESSSPLIEVDGQLQFSLPGAPLFPALPVDAVLQPTLTWLLRSDKPAKFDAELAYITGGLSWDAAYNMVAPADDATASKTGQPIEMTGLVTISNRSGKSFVNANIKLIAGDLHRVQSSSGDLGKVFSLGTGYTVSPGVTQKTFDEYHLYNLGNPTTLLDQETKQVEFLKAPRVMATTGYLYDGAQYASGRFDSYGWNAIRSDNSFGTQSHATVSVALEFQNNAANGLGIPLPKGKLRFYRRDADGQLEFTGERQIDHTPQGETVRVTTGDAFDLVGERLRTDYKIDSTKKIADESFRVTLRNRKSIPVQIRVLEHLYRGENWTIPIKSDQYSKKDANTIEFPVTVPAQGEKIVTYTAHYTW